MPVANPFDFSGQVVLLTGPTGTLGRPMAHAFADAGATLALADVDDAANEALAAETNRPDAETLAVHMDFLDPASVQTATDSVVQQLGAIDVLVNLAGINHRQTATEYPIDTWDRVVGVDLRGTWLACQTIGRVMVQQERGRIVNIASGAAFGGAPGYVAYSPAKAGVVALTRVLGGEWAPHGVAVNAIAPGHTDSPMVDKMMPDSAQIDAAIARMPVHQLLPPDAQVAPTMFLASDAARWITGITLRVDGGWHTT
jgi:NAD(P)-dependent dehydrogenase (short-subunit alcohol dehydrogenase family)